LGKGLKVHKIDDVKFSVAEGDNQMHPLDRLGELHIAETGIVIREGESIYRISFPSLRSVEVVSNEPLRLRLTSKGFQLEMEGCRAERLWALRSLILPIINGDEKPKPGTKTLLILLGAGVKGVPHLASIMGLDENEVQAMLDDFNSEGIITDSMDMTQQALSLFTPSEKDFLVKLGVKC